MTNYNLALLVIKPLSASMNYNAQCDCFKVLAESAEFNYLDLTYPISDWTFYVSDWSLQRLEVSLQQGP